MVEEFVRLFGAVLFCELTINLFFEAKPLAFLRRLAGIEDTAGLPIECGDDETGKGCAWYSRLLSCSYCLSVWVGVLAAFLFNATLFEVSWWPMPLTLVINGLIVHRLGHAWHTVLVRMYEQEEREIWRQLVADAEVDEAVGMSDENPGV